MVSITRRAHCLIEQGDAIRVVPESQAGTAQVLETVRPFGSARLAALLRDHHK